MKDQFFSGRVVTVVYPSMETIAIKIVEAYDDGLRGSLVMPEGTVKEGTEVVIPFTAISTIILDTDE